MAGKRKVDHCVDPTSKTFKVTHSNREVDEWIRKLTGIEEQALRLIRPFDVNNFEPMARRAIGPKEMLLHAYFRVMISSEEQNARARPKGRGSDWFLFDRVSGAILGIWSISDPQLPWHPVTRWVGSMVGAIRHGGHNTSHHIIQMKRCLPIFEFGQLTGGKLMALIATSKEMIEQHELQYSFPVALLVVKTMKGKASQYNRLHSRGLFYWGEATDGAGVYMMQMRENSKELLAEKTRDAGAFLGYGLGDQIEHWRTRWLPNRIDRTVNGIVTPDRERYRLSSVYREKATLRVKLTPETPKKERNSVRDHDQKTEVAEAAG